MNSTDQLRAQIDEAHALLCTALENVEDRWQVAILAPEDGVGEAWTPRRAPQHALAVELMYTAVLDGALSGAGRPTMDEAAASVRDVWNEALVRRSGAPRVHLHTAAEARAAIEEQAARVGAVLARAADADLDAPAHLWDGHLEYLERHGYEASRTIAGLLRLFAAHCFDHAHQLARAP